MEIIRQSKAQWKGEILSGSGHLNFGSASFSGPYSFKDRIAETSPLTNPEELIAAAHAGCFSMAFSLELTKEGAKGIDIQTVAKVHLKKTVDGFSLSEIHLETQVTAQEISEKRLNEIAVFAKKNCPVSKALACVTITLTVNGQPQ